MQFQDEGVHSSILVAAFLVLVSCSGVQHAKAAEVKDGVRIERDISYVPDGDSSQRLDLYLPEKPSDKPQSPIRN